MNIDPELTSPFFINIILGIGGMIILLFGWFLFKAGIYSIGFLSGFLLSTLFIFSLALDNLVIELFITFLLGTVLGVIFAKGLWHIHKYILALVGLLTSILVNFWFQIPSLFKDDGTRLLYLVIVTILCMAIFVFAEKYLVIFLSSFLGSLLIHRFIFIEWEVPQKISTSWNQRFPEQAIAREWYDIIFFGAFFLTGILFQITSMKRKKKHAYPQETESQQY